MSNRRALRVKTVPVGKDGPFEPNMGDAAGVAQIDLDLAKYGKFRVYRLRLVSDEVDRDFEHFSVVALHQFAEQLPGQRVLIGSAPIGTFYRAEVVEEGNAHHLIGYWYIPVTDDNEHERKAIDAGIWGHVSIGFMWEHITCDLCGAADYRSDACPHLLGEEYQMLSLEREDGVAVPCTATYQPPVQIAPDSIVVLGAQSDAQLVNARLVRAQDGEG